MIRTFKLREHYVMFVEWRPYRNHSKTHLFPVSKGSFETRSRILQWGIGLLWQWFGIGGRQ
jgi:hypothetical protein